MNIDKLHEIIAAKNERLERETVNQARDIIDQIGSLQSAKTDIDRKLVELRTELRALEIVQVDATSILGA